MTFDQEIKLVHPMPITPTLRRVSLEASSLNKGSYIFTSSGSPIKNHYKLMREACERAGWDFDQDFIIDETKKIAS